MKTQKKYKHTHTHTLATRIDVYHRCFKLMNSPKWSSPNVGKGAHSGHECIRIRSSEKICISRKKYTHTRLTIWATEAASRATNEKKLAVSFFPVSFRLFLQLFDSLNQKGSLSFLFIRISVFLSFILGGLFTSLQSQWIELIRSAFSGNMQRFTDSNLSNRIYFLYS